MVLNNNKYNSENTDTICTKEKRMSTRKKNDQAMKNSIESKPTPTKQRKGRRTKPVNNGVANKRGKDQFDEDSHAGDVTIENIGVESNIEIESSKTEDEAQRKRHVEDITAITQTTKIARIDDSSSDVIIEMVQDDQIIMSTVDSSGHAEEKEMTQTSAVEGTSHSSVSNDEVVVIQSEVVEETVTTSDTNIEVSVAGDNQDFSLELGEDNGQPQVQVVVEQEIAEDNSMVYENIKPEAKYKKSSNNTATVAAPQGVNPAMMSNLLHTAAAVAASQNAAAATVQVVPGQATGTIQLVPSSEVQNTQTLMASGIAPQSLSPQTIGMGEDGKPHVIPQPTSQPVFTYLVTSQGTLIAAHSSDGTPLISPALNNKETAATESKKLSEEDDSSCKLFIAA